MQRRLQIAQSLLATPEVLLLDEPTAGLDPIQRQRVLDLVAHLPGPHHVLISTHILADLLGLAEEVVVLHRGRVAAVWSWDVDTPPDEDAVTGDLAKIVGAQ
jgi:ABC-type multidrug transport system ATPase subunit